MGCCRGRRRRPVSREPTGCRELEREGARLRLFPVRTQNGLRFVLAAVDGQKMEIGSYLSAHGCNGPVSTTIRRRLAAVTASANRSPRDFMRFSGSGIPLSDLLRMA